MRILADSYMYAKKEEKMRILLVAALFLFLVASTYSQNPPTLDQLQCITDASTDQAQDIINDCANVNVNADDVRMYYSYACSIIMFYFSPVVVKSLRQRGLLHPHFRHLQ